MPTIAPDLYTLHPDGRYRKYPLVGDGELGPETPRPFDGKLDAEGRIWSWIAQGWSVTVQALFMRPEGERYTCEVSETEGHPMPRGIGYVCGYGDNLEQATADAAHKIATDVVTEDGPEERAMDAIITMAMRPDLEPFTPAAAQAELDGGELPLPRRDDETR